MIVRTHIMPEMAAPPFLLLNAVHILIVLSLQKALYGFSEFRIFLQETDMNWLFKGYANFANFSGRACREEFSMFALFWFFFLIVTAWIALSFKEFADVIVTLYILVSALPMLSMSVRRLHDMGWSGIWLAGLFASGGSGVLALMMVSGQPGENKYGPDPLVKDS
jgi:uncharacterized membrane protein YhaH (DUF805 family)